MAFTAAPPPMDKEQGAFRQGSEELAMANDNFFGQYVSFETVEPTTFDCGPCEEPPSPSILLDSLDCFTNSSGGQDQPPVQHLAEAIARPGLPMLSVQHARAVPALCDHPPDLALGRGSISDSELLRLEGISLRSPRVSNSPSSSPRLLPSSPLSPRRNRRFLDSVHATVWRAAHHPITPGQALAAAPPLDTLAIKTEPAYHAMPRQPQNVADQLMEPAYGPIDCNGLPLSPPLTGKLPSESQHPRGTQYVHGHLEDPFSEEYVALHPARTRAHGERTPLCTPILRNDVFCNASQLMDLAHPAFQQHKQRSTSSAEWPVESLATTDPRAPWAAGHDGADGRNLRAPDGWAEDAEGTPAGGRPPHDPHGVTIHAHQPREPPYEGPPYEPADGLSELMIHMPLPGPPPAAAPLLTAPLPPELPLGTPTTTPRRRATAAHPPAASAAPSSHRPRALCPDWRPPPPPPPTSGARHHGADAGLASPRKPSALHRSASRPLLVHPHHPHRRGEDEPPASPTPATPSSAAAGAPRRRSSSMSARKQRSWSHREPRTPNLPSIAWSPGPGGDGGVDFVNFTPSDKNVLMHGVAPSGSSKTKARREKEALDRRRKLSEAAYKAVQAAGGDIERLRAEVSSL